MYAAAGGNMTGFFAAMDAYVDNTDNNLFWISIQVFDTGALRLIFTEIFTIFCRT